MKTLFATIAVPGIVAVAGIVAIVLWLGTAPSAQLQARVSGLDGAPPLDANDDVRPLVVGQPVRSGGRPADVPGAWPWFRGGNLDAICRDGVRLARQWPDGGPRRLWEIQLGQGYAGPAVRDGRVYVLDYDETAKADVMRCLSLENGSEIWRNSYPVEVAKDHGMSRTVPAIVDRYVVSLGPRCDVVCWDAETGESPWQIDLVARYGTKVPNWHAGQCPLIDVVTDRLILAPGGKALVIAVDYRTGKVVWESPNPGGWDMTHSSITPMEFAGRRMYVYCGSGGVAGVSADDGTILWEFADWTNDFAMCPSPVVLDGGRVFLTSGYRVGSLMLQLRGQGGGFVADEVFRLKDRDFGCEQQTPILYENHIYGASQKGGQLVCLDLEGQRVWDSQREKFNAGPYLIADGLIYIMNNDGWLTMAEATPAGYRPLGRAEVLPDGHDSWGPMAMVAGRLIVRDMTRMVCLDVAEP